MMKTKLLLGNDIEQALIELGIKRNPLYERQRESLEEMEGLRDVTDKRGNDNTNASKHPMRL